MKRYVIISITIFSSLTMYGQKDTASNLGFGLDMGFSKGCFGSMGFFANYCPVFFNNHIELNAGLGIGATGATRIYGFGAKYKLYDNLKNFELLLSCNYSNRSAGNDVEDVNSSITDEYSLSATQFLHYYLTGRLFPKNSASIQLDCGYAQNISGYSIQLINGPGLNYTFEKYAQSSEIMVEIDFIYFIKFKNKS